MFHVHECYTTKIIKSLGQGTVLQAFNPIIWETETDEKGGNLVSTTG